MSQRIAPTQMQCLVTGATGFIGRALCRELIDRGHTVRATSLRGGAVAGGLSAQALDLTDEQLPGALFDNVSAVFHLAGIAHRSAQPALYDAVNERGTVALAKAASAAGVERFVYLSSVKAMGPATGDEPRGEDAIAAAANPYGGSKARAEQALREAFAGSGMAVYILRPTLVFGPGVKGNLARLARAVARGLPRPPQGGQRSMIACQDLVALMCQLALEGPPGVHTWIASGVRDYSTREVYDLMRTSLGKGVVGSGWLPAPGWRMAAALMDLLRSGDGERSYDKLFASERYDGSLVSAQTGWRPHLTLEEQVDELMRAALA